MPHRLTDAIKERIAGLLPTGYPVETLRFMECAALMRPMGEASDDEQALSVRVAEVIKKAGGPPALSDGKPTLMRVVAWMAHTGVNKNRLAFTEEGLKAAAETITPANPLAMDFNHSAVFQYEGAQRLIGHWYKAEYAFNPKAKKGKGAHGIMVTGVFFAWAFPEIAQSLLADQQRLGFIRFSMACVSKTTERAEDDEGQWYEIAHDPVFFTNAALDCPNADVDASGLGLEGAPAEIEDKLARALKADYGEKDEELLALVASLPGGESPNTQTQPAPVVINAAAVTTEEVGMNDAEKLAFETLTAANEAFTARVAELMAELAAEQAKVATIPGLESQIAELSTAKEGLATEFTALQATLEQKDAEIAAFQTKEAEEATRAAAAAAAQVLAARIAALPDSYRTAHAKKDDEKRALVEAKWTAMTDSEWEFYCSEELFSGVNLQVGYVKRTGDVLQLPVDGAADQSIKARIAKVKK